MNLLGLSGLLTGINSLSMAFLVYLKGRKNALNRLWAVFAISVAIWGFGGYKLSTITDETAALLWWRFTYIGIILIPALFLHFVYTLLEIKRKKIIITVYLFSSIFLITNFVSKNLFIGNLKFVFSSFYWLVPPGPICIFFIIFSFFGLAIHGIYALFSVYKTSSGVKRNQIRYFSLAALIGFSAGGTCFLPCFGIKLYPGIGNFGVAFYVIPMAYAIIKYRLMDITVAITRAIVYGLIYTVVFALPLLIGTLARQPLKILLGPNWWMIPLGVFVFLSSTAPYVGNFFRSRAEERILREQRRYQQTLRQASLGMTRIRELNKLLKLIAHTLTRSIKITHAGIYLLDRETNRYLLKAKRGKEKIPEVSLEGNSLLIRQLHLTKDALVHEEIKRRLEDRHSKELSAVEESMGEMKASLIIPSFVGEKLLGFLVLGDKLSGAIYTQDDINVFSVMANQAALAIENAQFFEDLQDTQAQLLHEEKLATIGRMANAIGHEINNPLSILFMNLQTMERDLKENEKLSPEVVSERLEKANQQAQRINVVVKELTHLFRETERGVMGALDLADLIEESRSLVRYQSGLGESLDNIEIVQDIPEDLPKVRGDSNQLQQVFLNLFTNACQAIGGKGKITITARISPEEADSVTIKFSDNGPGISKEFLNKIFDYRFTRKEKGKGTGMGLFVVRYIMTLHEGSISAESEPGKGTTFTLKLPIRREEA